MKKLFTSLFVAAGLCVSFASNAQSFTIHHDTTYINTSGSYSAENNITVPGSSSVTVQWRVISSNLPTSWMSTVGVCDNVACYSSGDIWPTTLKTATYPTGTGDFHVTIDLTGVPVWGTFVMRIKLNNQANTSDSAIQTYIISKTSTSVGTVTNVSEVSIYPNPASNTLNVVYDAAADIKNVAIYNIIGRQMNMFRVTDDNSASLNIENLPSGVYFVRLLNSHGDVTATRKFTKQ